MKEGELERLKKRFYAWDDIVLALYKLHEAQSYLDEQEHTWLEVAKYERAKLWKEITTLERTEA